MREDYPFFDEWAERQAEPMPDIGVDWSQRSPYAFDRLPERKTEEETLFERKEEI